MPRSSGCISSRSAASPPPPTTPARSPRVRAGRGHDRNRPSLRPRRHARRHRPPAPRRLRHDPGRARPANCRSPTTGPTSWARPTPRSSSASSRARTPSRHRPQGGDVPRQPRRQRRRRWPASTPCSTGPRRTASAARSSPTPRAPTPRRCSPPPASPSACRRSSSARNARAAKPDPAPYRAAMALLGATPSRSDRLRGQPLGPARRPRLRRPRLRPDHRPRARRTPPGRRARGDRRLHRPGALGASRPSSRPASHDPHHRRISKSRTVHHRLRPAVLRDRRAHQPHRPQEPRRPARGRRFLHRRGRRARAGRLRRARCSTSTRASSSPTRWPRTRTTPTTTTSSRR